MYSVILQTTLVLLSTEINRTLLYLEIALCEKWKYGDTPLKIVNVYKYLGVYLSTRLSFSHALKDMSQRAKKGVICIFNLL